jgi:hypothetical protein
MRFSLIPEHLRDGMRRYIFDGVPTGDFLAAVLANDLRDAAVRADHINLMALPEIVRFLHNEAPAACWGDARRVRAWTETGGLRGLSTETAA